MSDISIENQQGSVQVSPVQNVLLHNSGLPCSAPFVSLWWVIYARGLVVSEGAERDYALSNT